MRQQEHWRLRGTVLAVENRMAADVDVTMLHAEISRFSK
jgi:hypothetical protein